MNSYYCSDGTRVYKDQLDRNVRDCKAKKLSLFLNEHGFFYCEACGRSDCLPITCAHLESVNSCQQNRHAEKAWDLDNIRLMCLKCHAKYDKNDVQLNFNK